jgi:hypothetical protein
MSYLERGKPAESPEGQAMLHETTSIGQDAMQDVRRIVNDSQTLDDLCGKLAQYWGVDELGLQMAAMEWKERTATRPARAAQAQRLLQLGKMWPSVDGHPDSEAEGALKTSRQIRLELLIEQIAEKVFPN